MLKLAEAALETLRPQDWQRLGKQNPAQAVWLKGTRFLLRRGADSLSASERTLIEELADTKECLYRGWLLLDQLGALDQAADAEQALLLLDEWLRAAQASVLVPLLKVAAALAQPRAAIVKAILLGLANARLEAINSTVRLISHRSCAFRRLDSHLALIQLVCGRVPVALPT